ncbi:hypothetical protein GGR50DRAFT_649173 [Xylaria sp. CBS 124048]|nr:hypothetical protein GGR50DRAFT_649173 [Xylaria sp. CBS 124048]
MSQSYRSITCLLVSTGALSLLKFCHPNFLMTHHSGICNSWHWRTGDVVGNALMCRISISAKGLFNQVFKTREFFGYFTVR